MEVSLNIINNCGPKITLTHYSQLSIRKHFFLQNKETTTSDEQLPQGWVTWHLTITRRIMGEEGGSRTLSGLVGK